MKELTITTETIGNEEISAVDARSLWVALGARRDFSNWIKDKVLNNIFFEENVDWSLLAQKGEAQPCGFAANRKDYILSIDTAKK